MVYSGLHRRDLSLFGILYHMCRMTGVLPVDWNAHPCQPNIPIVIDQDQFSPSLNYKTLTILNVVFCLAFVFFLAPEELDMTLYTFLWVTNSTSVLAAVLVPLFNIQDLASCLSSASRIHSLSPKLFRLLPIPIFLFMVLTPYFTIIFLWIFFANVLPFKTLVRITWYNYMYTPVTNLEVIISCLCFVAERAFSDVRIGLNYLRYQRFTVDAFSRLKTLLDKYLKIASFVSEINNTFSIHFLNIFFSFTLRLIIYSAYFISYTKEDRVRDITVVTIHGIYLVVRLLFLCYRWEKLKEEAVESTLGVSRIRILWVGYTTASQSALLDTYDDLIEATPINFAACGFFQVNMLQALNVLGLVITYSLVASQSTN